MRKLLAPFFIIVIITGCVGTPSQRVMFAEESLTAAINLVATSLESGAIDVEKAKDLRAKLKDAETALASARFLVLSGKVGEGNRKLDVARNVLIEVHKILLAREQ